MWTSTRRGDLDRDGRPLRAAATANAPGGARRLCPRDRARRDTRTSRSARPRGGALEVPRCPRTRHAGRRRRDRRRRGRRRRPSTSTRSGPPPMRTVAFGLVYAAASTAEQTERTVDPEVVFASSGQWYVAAGTSTQDDERLLRVDRIDRVDPTEETFEPRGLAGAGRPLYSPGGGDVSVRLRLHRPPAGFRSTTSTTDPRGVRDGSLDGHPADQTGWCGSRACCCAWGRTPGRRRAPLAPMVRGGAPASGRDPCAVRVLAGLGTGVGSAQGHQGARPMLRVEMTTIRTTCPRCGEVDMGPESILLSVRANGREGSYRFTCPECEDAVEKRADRKIVALLVSAGVDIDRGADGLPSRHPELFDDERGRTSWPRRRRPPSHRTTSSSSTTSSRTRPTSASSSRNAPELPVAPARGSSSRARMDLRVADGEPAHAAVLARSVLRLARAAAALQVGRAAQRSRRRPPT